MRAHFILAIDNLESMLDENAERVIKALESARGAMEEGNPKAAQRVIAGDAEINLGENRIEEECLKLLALYQPVAGDLRRIIAILKINGELERCGDLAVNIANRVDTPSGSHLPEDAAHLDRMATKSLRMLVDSVRAFRKHDAVSAERIIAQDDEIDEIHRANYARVKELLESGTAVAPCLDYLTFSRAFERIADVSTNIAEDVVYLESGKIIRHAG